MKRSYFIAFALIIFGVGLLAFVGFSFNASYFVDVAEAKNLPVEKLQSARVFGTVFGIKSTGQKDMEIAFAIIDRNDKKTKMDVRYAGVLPNAFKEGAEVIVEGNMESDFFNAKTLITKCPSKYMKENRKE